MQCLACVADNTMLLMDVLRDDTIKVPVIEHQIYMCSACRHIARRLVFRRTQMPITHLPVTTTPVDTLWKGRVAAPRAWGNAIEKLRSGQTDLKQRGAAAKITPRTTDWRGFMKIPMVCGTICVIVVVSFMLPGVARLMIHTPTAISIFVWLIMVQLMAVFISMRCTLWGHFPQVAVTLTSVEAAKT